MSNEEQIIALRGSKGIKFCYAPPVKQCETLPPIESSCREMIFSTDGKLMSWCTQERTQVLDCDNYNTICKIEDPKITAISFSPKGSYLSTWSPYSAKETPQESCNLHIWDVKTGALVKSFIQKKQVGWTPQWSDDEKLCVRNVNNEVHFFEDANFDKIANIIRLQKVAYFSLAPGGAPYHIACYVPGTKGYPSFVRLFKYPNFDTPVAQKSFFKAERTDFYWNKTGKDCIFLTSVDVDKSGMSYYGELNLYYASVKGDSARIKPGKDGPVYSVQWSPSSKEFCVVYGFMPAKATIYNLKCDSVLDFEAAPRNEVNYSPVGDRLALSGFGNLQGQIEVWDLKLKKKISQFKAADSTYIEWSCDGEYILTATTAPRLRIGNGYRVWHYTGSLLVEIFLEKNEELYGIKWKPFPDGTFKDKPTTYLPVAGIKSVVPEKSKEVYRPPAAQGKQASFKLHDEPKTGPAKDVLSKNQKRKLAKEAKKESEKAAGDTEKSVATTPEVSSSNKGSNVSSSNTTNKVSSSNTTDDVEKTKKIRALKKKLNEIEKLKNNQREGKTLEPSQMQKIARTREIEAELAELQLT